MEKNENNQTSESTPTQKKGSDKTSDPIESQPQISPNVSDTPLTPQKKVSKKLILIGFIFLIIVLIISGLYFYMQKQRSNPKTQESPQNAQETPSPTPDLTANWKTYTDPGNKFSLNYPSHLDFKEYKDGLILSYGDPSGENWKNSIWFSLSIHKTTVEEYLKNNPCEGKDAIEERPKSLYKSCIKTFQENKQEYTIDNIKGIRSVWNPYEYPSTIDVVEHAGYVFVFKHNSGNDDALANQILSTFKFMDNIEKISALKVYSPGKLTDNQRDILSDVYWPSLSPFSPNDKEREVYLVDCEVIGEKPWYKLTGIPEKVPNTENVIELTLNKLVEKHFGGFPDQNEIANLQENFNISYKNQNSGINGVQLNKDGTLIVNFFDSVAAYGGGSSRVACMSFAVNLTALQFPEVNSVIMCIDKYPNEENENCFYDFQP